MADETAAVIENDAEEALSARIYEVGYHINPDAKEEDLEKIVGSARSLIEQAGGSFIAEGAPAMTRLAYPVDVRQGEKHIAYDRGYFGWIKFEGSVVAAQTLEQMLKKDAQFIRYIVFQTVREDTRAKMKAPQLREVKRTDTIRTTVRRAEESTAPVSEEQLEKAILDITTE